MTEPRPLVLPYGGEYESHPQPKFNLGQHARSPDNRRFYYSLNENVYLPRGVVVAAPIPKDVPVLTITPGGPGHEKMVQTFPGVRYGITLTDVKKGHGFWMQTWGPAEILCDWMDVAADNIALFKQSIPMAWMYEDDKGDYRFVYMTTAA